MEDNVVTNLFNAITNQDRVNGLTHTFYRYPARFSPVFARAVIETFSNKGDVVYDPFMGGGTTLVEASALGRVAIGSDINSLAVFISRVKTTLLTKEDIFELQNWAKHVKKINIRGEINPNSEWRELGYQKNINCKKTWRIRKIIDVTLYQADIITSESVRNFVRCAILKTAQWALDCRDNIPSVKLFRQNLFININEMVEGAKQYSASVNNFNGSSEIYHKSVINIDTCENAIIPIPKLVLTSPPYPGYHVLYHRWQVLGRRETPAPYWIANCYDSKGASYYTFGDRKDKSLDHYYETLKAAFTSIANISDEQTVIVQMVSFQNPQEQLPRYLGVMEECGFNEFYISGSEKIFKDDRLWREVPNRKWYTAKTKSSAIEVVLFHKLIKKLNPCDQN